MLQGILLVLNLTILLVACMLVAQTYYQREQNRKLRELLDKRSKQLEHEQIEQANLKSMLTDNHQSNTTMVLLKEMIGYHEKIDWDAIEKSIVEHPGFIVRFKDVYSKDVFAETILCTIREIVNEYLVDVRMNKRFAEENGYTIGGIEDIIYLGKNPSALFEEQLNEHQIKFINDIMLTFNDRFVYNLSRKLIRTDARISHNGIPKEIKAICQRVIVHQIAKSLEDYEYSKV